MSQEAGQVVWYSHLFQNFPQFVLIHTLKGFGIVNKAEVDILMELSCFFNDPMDVGILICGSSAFSKSSLNIWKFMVHILLFMYCPLLLVIIFSQSALAISHSQISDCYILANVWCYQCLLFYAFLCIWNDLSLRF